MNRLLSVALITFVASAPVLAQRKIEQIVARVNSDIILKSDLDRETDLRRDELIRNKADAETIEKEMTAYSKDLLSDLIDRALLLQVAKEAGLNADIEVLRAMEELQTKNNFASMDDLEKAIKKDYGDLDEFKNQIRTNYLTKRVIDHEVYGHIIITDEEMRKFYDEHKQEFDKPAGVRLSEVAVLFDPRVPDQKAVQRKKIEEAFAAVKKGDKFEDIVKKYSEVSTAGDDGDMGFISAELGEAITKAISGLAKNQTSEIVELDDAYEIYKLTDRHSGGILSFDLARRSIENAMMSEVAPPKVREFLGKLREDGFVDVKEGFEDTGAVKPKNKTAAPTKP